MVLKTDFQLEKEARERRIYDEFVALSSEQGTAVTEVTKLLMKKYGIHSTSTIWAIRKRVENRLRGEKGGEL